MRFAAGFFNSTITGIPFYIIYSILILSGFNLIKVNVITSLSILLVYSLFTLFYFVYFDANKGQTPGKKIYGLKVINKNTNSKLTYVNAFKREFINRFLLVIPLIGAFYILINFFIMISSDERRGIHDKISGSQVIIVNKSWPIWKQFLLLILLVIPYLIPTIIPIKKSEQDFNKYNSCVSTCIELMGESGVTIKEQYNFRDDCIQACREERGY